jgi:hypothetical protein
MFVAVGDFADMQRKRSPPRRTDPGNVVDAAAAQNRSHMDDRNAQRPGAIVKGIDRRDDLARPRRRTRTLRRWIEMAAVHVDRHDRRLRRIEVILKQISGVLRLPVNINAHLCPPERRLRRRAAAVCLPAI